MNKLFLVFKNLFKVIFLTSAITVIIAITVNLLGRICLYFLPIISQNQSETIQCYGEASLCLIIITILVINFTKDDLK